MTGTAPNTAEPQRAAARLRTGLVGLASAYIAWLLLGPRPLTFWRLLSVGVVLGALASWAASRRAPAAGRWRDFSARTSDLHLLGLALLAGLAAQQVLTEGVTSDGCIYFAHLRSLVFDHDLQIDSELRVLGLPPRPHHVVAIGPAAVWAPLYLIVALVDWIARAIGWAAAPDRLRLGLTGAYVRAALIPSYIVAAIGLVAVHVRLRREFGRGIALLASLLLFGATPLAWYAIYEPAMSHAASFGLVALFIVLAERWIDRLTPARACALGALFSLAVVVRPQDALFAAFPLAFLLTAGRPEGLRYWALAGWAALGAAPLFILQAALGVALFAGQSSFRLAGSGGYLHLLDARWLDVLFSSRHGLLSWTPIVYVALVGSIAYLRRDRRWAIATLAVFCGMWWINASAEDWWGGWAFGGRRFTSMLAALAPGLALVIWQMARRPMLLVGGATAAALVWNALLMFQYNRHLLPRNDPIGFATMVRQQAELWMKRPYGYPFTFPASLLFSLREGVPADRYDLLASVPLAPRVELPFDARIDAYLLEGWQAAGEPDPAGPYRWMIERQATLVAPLDLPPDAPAAIELLARAERERGPVRVELSVSVNGQEVGRVGVPTTPATVRVIVPAGDWQRVWRRGYNRVTLGSLAVIALDEAGAAMPQAAARERLRLPWPVAIFLVRVAPASQAPGAGS